MSAVRELLEGAHRDAARAAGSLSLMIARGTTKRDDLRIAISRLRAAAEKIEMVLSKEMQNVPDTPC